MSPQPIPKTPTPHTWAIATGFGLALPWLLHFSLGPSPVVLQSLASGFALCAWVLMMTAHGYGPDRAKLDWRKGVLLSWILAAALSSVMGLLQYFDAAQGLQPWVSASEGVAFANLRQRNQFAVLCLMGLAALWGVSASGPSASDRAAPRLSASGLAALLVIGAAASQSRTGLIGLVALTLMFWCWSRPAQTLKYWALPLYALSAWALPLLSGAADARWGVLTRLAEGDLSCQSRLTLWANVLHLIAQKPWTGWGWGELDYAHYISLFPGERFCAMLDNAHNLPLHLAVELGIPLALLICAVVWRQRPWAATEPTQQTAWMVLTLIALHSLLEYPLWYGPFQLAVLLCIALLWKKSPLQPTRYALAAIIFIVFMSYAAWDYLRISQIYLNPSQRSPRYAEQTLEKVQGSALFGPQVHFAELATTPLTQENAPQQLHIALDLLHFSPEPRVIERVLDATDLLGDQALLAFHLRRYQAAYPHDYSLWHGKTRASHDSHRAEPTMPP